MIEFKFNCPGCGQHILANDGYSGRQINCPTCQAILVVPSAPGAPPPVPMTAVPSAPPTRSAMAAPAASGQRSNPAAQRPVPAQKKSGKLWLVVGGVAAFVVAGGISFAVFSGAFSHSTDTSATAPDKKASAHKDAGSSPVAGVTGLSAAEIVQKVTDAYAAFNSYSAEGSAVTVMDMSKVDVKSIPGMNQVPSGARQSKEMKDTFSKPIKTENDFTVKLGRPGFYRVEWNMKVGVAGQQQEMKGAAWSTGEGDFLLMNPAKYVKLDNRSIALASATGVSGGVAASLPAIFFNDGTSQLNSFKTAERTKDETVDGDDCYVLHGKTMGIEMVLWVTKDAFLIKQKQTIFGGKTSMPDVSDAQIDAQLKKMGNMTPQQIAQAKAAAKQMKPMMSQMKGKMTETYHNIVTNQSLTKADFKYEVPPGATLSKSLF